MKKLGKIEQIPLREVWKHEALDFTNWLAEEENLALLSDELSINLSLIQTEYQVGSFFIDILAEIEETGKKVIKDMQFSSPSSASTFVFGSPSNGWTDWKDENGRTLDDIYRKE